MSSSDNEKTATRLPVRPWERTKAKQVSELLPSVLSDVIARRNGMTLDLLAGWEDIVGPAYASCTLPEKIIWPKNATDTDALQSGSLVVACDSTKALFFQHETTQILQRVNFFFGFEAISRIKLVQKHIQKHQRTPPATRSLSPEEKDRLNEVLAHIDDPNLRKSLKKFGSGVILRSKSQNKG